MSEPHDDLDARIRERAYHLWEAAGRPEGRDEEFWHRAHSIEAADKGSELSIPASDPPAHTGIVGPND